MEKDIATLLDAAAFQVADMIGPATVLEGAGRHLLDRLDETDPHRWAVTSALGSITAARKSLTDAAEALLDVVAKDGADMLAVEVNNGEIREPLNIKIDQLHAVDIDPEFVERINSNVKRLPRRI